MLGRLPDGGAGTRATLQVMARLVRTYRKAPSIRDAALSLVRDVQEKNWTAEVRRIFDYVRDSIRYVRDIRGVETVQTPEVTLDVGQGDCDDKSTLLASLLESIGHPTRFVAVGFRSPGSYSHVFVQTLVGRQWISLDPIVHHEAGWEAPRAVARMIVHV